MTCQWVVGVEAGVWGSMTRLCREKWRELADEIEVYVYCPPNGGRPGDEVGERDLFQGDNVTKVSVGGFRWPSRALALVYNHLFQAATQSTAHVSLITHRDESPLDYNTSFDRNNRDDVFTDEILADCGVEYVASSHTSPVVGLPQLEEYVKSLFTTEDCSY